MGITSFGLSRIDAESAVMNATSIVEMEMDRMIRPNIIFLGSDTMKSSKEYLAVKMLRNMNTEVQEAKKERLSIMMNARKCPSLRRRGVPEVPSVPPGTVKMA